MTFAELRVGYSIFRTFFSISLSDPLSGGNGFRKSIITFPRKLNRPMVSFIDLSTLAKGFSICRMALSALDSQLCISVITTCSGDIPIKYLRNGIVTGGFSILHFVYHYLRWRHTDKSFVEPHFPRRHTDKLIFGVET